MCGSDGVSYDNVCFFQVSSKTAFAKTSQSQSWQKEVAKVRQASLNLA